MCIPHKWCQLYWIAKSLNWIYRIHGASQSQLLGNFTFDLLASCNAAQIHLNIVKTRYDKVRFLCNLANFDLIAKSSNWLTGSRVKADCEGTSPLICLQAAMLLKLIWTLSKQSTILYVPRVIVLTWLDWQVAKLTHRIANQSPLRGNFTFDFVPSWLDCQLGVNQSNHWIAIWLRNHQQTAAATSWQTFQPLVQFERQEQIPPRR